MAKEAAVTSSSFTMTNPHVRPRFERRGGPGSPTSNDSSAGDSHPIMVNNDSTAMRSSGGRNKPTGVRSSPSLCLIGRRYPLLVEAALMHGVGLAHEDVGRDLVLGAAELSERREQNEIIEGLFRQGQAERPGFRAIFRSGHSKTPHRL